MYQIAVWSVLVFPFVGLCLLSAYPDDYNWLAGNIQAGWPLIYYGLFLLGCFFSFFLLRRKREFFGRVGFSHEKCGSVLLLLSLLSIFLIVLFFYGGFDVLAGELTKSDVRRSGFLHAVLAKYMAPAIFAYICILRREYLVGRTYFVFCLFLIATIGMSGGGKANILFALLPGFSVMLSGRLGFFGFVGLLLGALISLVVSAIFFDSFLDGDFVTIIDYLVRRAFVLTAEAPYHVAVAYSAGEHVINYTPTLFEVFGKSLISNFVPRDELHLYLFSHSITAWLYPENIEAIVSGEWNVTPSVFVEALLVGGAVMLPVFGALVIYGSHLLWNAVVKSVNRADFSSAAVLSVYAIFVYLSWLNSAGVMQLLHPLPIGSLVLSWFWLRIITKSFRL